MAAPFVAVAAVARAHGIRGELRVRPFNEASELLLGKPLLRLRLADGTERDAVIATVRRVNRALLVTLEGVSDRNGAEALHGATLLVRRDAFLPTDEDEFYACDVEGAVVTLDSQEIGRVKSIASYPTCDALVIDRGALGLIEVPLVDAYVAKVDVEQKQVELVTLEGLG